MVFIDDKKKKKGISVNQRKPSIEMASEKGTI